MCVVVVSRVSVVMLVDLSVDVEVTVAVWVVVAIMRLVNVVKNVDVVLDTVVKVIVIDVLEVKRVVTELVLVVVTNLNKLPLSSYVTQPVPDVQTILLPSPKSITSLPPTFNPAPST